jgi:hypothetical protein
MSFVHLLIRKGNNIYNLHLHWRTAERILKEGFEEFARFLPAKYMDAGYMVVDADEKIIVTHQDAFKVEGVKGFEVVEV